MKENKAILKTEEGLIQLLRCPTCRYMVRQLDIVWSRQPTDMLDDGEIRCCRFCEENEAKNPAHE